MGMCNFSVGGWRHVESRNLLISQPGSNPDLSQRNNAENDKIYNALLWLPHVYSWVRAPTHTHVSTNNQLTDVYTHKQGVRWSLSKFSPSTSQEPPGCFITPSSLSSLSLSYSFLLSFLLKHHYYLINFQLGWYQRDRDSLRGRPKKKFLGRSSTWEDLVVHGLSSLLNLNLRWVKPKGTSSSAPRSDNGYHKCHSPCRRRRTLKLSKEW